ncbi:Nucleolar, Nop52 [Cordyceps militaris CM01]|uniref:Nucleolar, Nop52 n=1 Tax=Cordyceps militaris (strain CM01) TaxID=983644 RepID=G3JR30_CORMM|nr:Nucleolar, Nop52 [Cordyceps militaris CM01]EGX88326.1 Nucleolar, Nop52 [Cordyceps militaris CM01]
MTNNHTKPNHPPTTAAMTARAGQEAASMPFIKNLASSGPSPHPRSASPLPANPSPPRRPQAANLFPRSPHGVPRRAPVAVRRGRAQALDRAVLRAVDDGPSEAAAGAGGGPGGAGVGAARAWTSIEALRLDKFLLLVRRVWAAMVRYAARAESAVVLAVCREYVFDGDGGDAGLGVLPLGLKLHVLDIWVDELEREGVLAEEKNKAWVREMGDLVEALRRNGTRVVRERAKESYEDERLPWAARPMEEDEEGEEDEDEDEGWGGIDD